MRKAILLLLVGLTSSMTNAQIKTVQLDTKYLQFDNGSKLPAQSAFVVNAPIASEISRVAMQISNKNFEKESYLYETTWQEKQQSSVANLVIMYKLGQNANYNFRFQYYRDINDAERAEMAKMLEQTCYSTLQYSILEKGNRFKFQNNSKEIYKSLNHLLKVGLSKYAKQVDASSTEFSEVVESQIKSISKSKADGAFGDETNISALKSQIATEIKMLCNSYQYILVDELKIYNYASEKISSALALNIGYGAIYESGEFNNLNYYSSPYAGLSFALGNKVFSSPFWNNTSLSAGVFLKNFDDVPNYKISGPFVGLPIYAALGYRVFNYFKINAGVTVLEEKNLITNNKNIYVRPFVGLSLEMYLWLGFNKNR